VDAAEIRRLLDRGRASSAESAPTSSAGSVRPSKYSALLDPAGAEKLGIALAAVARDIAPSLVVIWEDVEDLVLGHIVARELGLPLVRIYNAEGLAASSSPIPAKASALLVSDAMPDAGPVRTAEALLKQAGGQLLAAALLVGSDSIAGIPCRSLVRANGAEAT